MLVEEKIENKEIAKQYKELLKISYQQLKLEDKKLIRLAFNTAVDAHKHQRRKSGEAYIFHPISVAKIVASEIGLDATSISAALLHDTIEDTNYKLFNTSEYKNKIVKVIVRKKSSPKEFQKFIDKLYRSEVQDLKIVENFAIVENEDFDIEEDENTISILNRYIEEAEIEFDKGIVKNIFRDLYRQACEVE